MAAVTLLGSVTFDTNSGTKTVTATPAVGDLIVIITAHGDNTSAATPTDDQSGTYTTILNSKMDTNAHTMMFHVRTALIPAASSTIFSHAPGTTTGGGLAVLKVTGMTRVGASAALQNAKQENQAGGTTPAPVFGATPQSGNPVIGAVFIDNANPAGISPRSSPAYTELADVGYDTPKEGLEIMSIDSGETSATITWGGNATQIYCDGVIELDISAMAYTLSCDPGSFAITGAPLTTAAARLLSCDPGSFAVTGAALTMNHGFELSCAPGVFTVTGADLTPLLTGRYDAPMRMTGGTVTRPKMTDGSVARSRMTGGTVARPQITDGTVRS